MGQINGTFIYNGKPMNGATAKLWQDGGFVSPPEFDDPEPNVMYQEGATLTTGVVYGGDGAFRWTSVPDDDEYYVSCYYDGHRTWLYVGQPASLAIMESLLTTQGDLILRGASVAERFAKITTGQYLKATATGYEGATLGTGTLVIAETQVFNGVSPVAWTDLDLSGAIGANSALVLLKLAETGNEGTVIWAVRKNGETDEFYSVGAVVSIQKGLAEQNSAAHSVLLTFTDSLGIIEWITGVARTVTIDVMGYMK